MCARSGKSMAEYRRARRIIGAQSLLSVILAMVALPFDVLYTRDILCGAGAAVLGSAISAYFTFGHYQAARPDAIVRRLYLGELARFSVIAGIFLIAALTANNINPVVLLATFFIVQVLPLVTVNLYDRKIAFGQRR